jgi:hypothetical protein
MLILPVVVAVVASALGQEVARHSHADAERRRLADGLPERHRQRGGAVDLADEDQHGGGEHEAEGEGDDGVHRRVGEAHVLGPAEPRRAVEHHEHHERGHEQHEVVDGARALPCPPHLHRVEQRDPDEEATGRGAREVGELLSPPPFGDEQDRSVTHPGRR